VLPDVALQFRRVEVKVPGVTKDLKAPHPKL
jgi:hypothetical protein